MIIIIEVELETSAAWICLCMFLPLFAWHQYCVVNKETILQSYYKSAVLWTSESKDDHCVYVSEMSLWKFTFKEL